VIPKPTKVLKQKSAMSRGKGFRRPEFVRPAPPAPTRATRTGVLADCAAMAEPAPKSPRAENPHLLSMARGKPCLIRSPICNYDVETTVACHGGGVANGKGLGYKVSDALTCWGCSACNHYTDAYGGATQSEKQEAFELGHIAQIEEWQAIAGSAAADPKDRLAARWALNHLNCMPDGLEGSE
jgi:hypothetical protein